MISTARFRSDAAVPEEREDAPRERHVEARRRLVGDEHGGRARERERDHHPLRHPAGQLVRVRGSRASGFADPDRLEERQRRPPLSGPSARRVRAEPVGDLAADASDGAERAARVLEAERGALAAVAAERLGAHRQHVAAVEPRHA